MPQIDIRLNSSADLAGFTAVQRAAAQISTGLDDFARKVSSKFKLGDVGKDLAAGLGIGSGMAIAERLSSLIIDHFRQAAEIAKSIELSTARSLKAVQESIRLNQTPAQQIQAAKDELEKLRAEKKRLETPVYDTVETVENPFRVPGGGSIQTQRALTEEQRKRLIELPALIQEADTAIRKMEKSLSESAKSTLAAVDGATKLEQEVKRINDLVGEGGLTRESADRMIEKLRIDAVIAEAEKRLRIIQAERQMAGPTLAESNAVTPDQEAAAAAAAAAAILRIQEDEAAEAIRAARQEVEQYDIALALLDANPAISDQEKYKQRVDLLNQQTDAIKRLKAELEEFAKNNPGIDVGGIQSAVDSLGKQGAQNAARLLPAQTLEQRDAIGMRDLSDPTKHYQNPVDGVAGSLSRQMAEVGTGADQISRAFDQAGQSVRTNLGGAFADMILTAGSMSQKVAQFGYNIATSFVQIGSQMVADWIFRHTVMAAWKKLFVAQDVAMTVGAEAVKTTTTVAGESTRTGAVVAGAGARSAAVAGEAGVVAGATGVAGLFRSIMELGPIAGPVVFAAAVAGMMALVSKVAGFETGGFPEGRNTLIRVNENGQESVLNARATAMLGRAGVDALNAGIVPNITRPAFVPPQGGVSGQSPNMTEAIVNALRSRQPVFVDERDHDALEALRRNPNFESDVIRIVSKHRGKLGIKW